MTRLEWLRKNAPHRNCPIHGGDIPHSWVKMTAWCQVCHAYWRIFNRTRNWKPKWAPLKVKE